MRLDNFIGEVAVVDKCDLLSHTVSSDGLPFIFLMKFCVV